MAFDLKQAGQLLQGFGAGWQGKGGEYVASIEAGEDRDRLLAEKERQDGMERRVARIAERDKLNEERQKALMIDNRVGLNRLENGDVDGFMQLATDRVKNIKRLGGDPEDTLTLMSLVRTGKAPEAMQMMKQVDQEASIRGILEPAKGAADPEIIKASNVSNQGQVYTRGPDGQIVAQDVGGFKPDETAAQKQDLARRKLELEQRKFQSQEDYAPQKMDMDQQRLAFDKQREERVANKMSAGLEKRLFAAQDAVRERSRAANRMDTLADDFQRYQPEAGAKRTISGFIESVMGSQGGESEFRRRFNEVRISQGLKNLPPGPATDKDMQQAFKGVPDENASPEQVQAFLRGAAKMARLDAGWNQFQADFITNTGDGRGLNQSWRKQIKSPVLDRPVSVAEVYLEAQSEGVPPEQIMQELGWDRNNVFTR